MDLSATVRAFQNDPQKALEKYPWFPDKYPRLHSVCTRDDFDVRVFDQLMAAKKKLESKELNAHDASVEVGALLVDKYVKPKLA
jgi:hypothetical protein